MSRHSNSRPVPSAWWRHPYCHYCGMRVIKSPVHQYSPLPKNAGTIEHIPPKWITRLLGGEDLPRKRVLACYGCNNRENKRVQLLYPPFFLMLWNEGRIAEPRRKMLPAGSHQGQEQDKPEDAQLHHLPLTSHVVSDESEGDNSEAAEEGKPVHLSIIPSVTCGK